MRNLTSKLGLLLVTLTFAHITVAQETTTIGSNVSQLSITLKSGKLIKGSPYNMEHILLDNVIGPITIPIDSVAGIHFGDMVTVELVNGDSLTGMAKFAEIPLAAGWGTCAVNTDKVEHIILAANSSWSQNGERWRLRSTIIPSTSTVTTR